VVMPELEDFQLGTSLDLKMTYYLLGFESEYKEITYYYAPYHNYEYQKLQIGLCNNSNILQEKLSELMADLETVRILY